MNTCRVYLALYHDYLCTLSRPYGQVPASRPILSRVAAERMLMEAFVKDAGISIGGRMLGRS
jgi:hypothetical protein